MLEFFSIQKVEEEKEKTVACLIQRHIMIKSENARYK